MRGELRALGVDYDDVVQVLEDHGLAMFDASWRELGDQVTSELRHPGGRPVREEGRK
jgi:transaldolase